MEATGVQWHFQDLLLQSNKVTEVAMWGNHTHMLRLKGMTPEDAGSPFMWASTGPAPSSLSEVVGEGGCPSHLTQSQNVQALLRDRSRLQASLFWGWELAPHMDGVLGEVSRTGRCS